MTEPTQAQIDAAVKAMKECSVGGELYYDEDFMEAAKAALTAAAQVGDHSGVDHDDGHGCARLVLAMQAATIERHVQVALNCDISGTHSMSDVREAIAAAIRALATEGK